MNNKIKKQIKDCTQNIINLTKEINNIQIKINHLEILKIKKIDMLDVYKARINVDLEEIK